MPRTFRWFLFGVILTLLIGLTRGPVPSVQAVAWQAKVDPWVLSTAPEGETEFLVYLEEQAGLRGADTLRGKSAKGTYVYETLTSIAGASQKPIQAMLDARGITYQSFWIANMLWVRGDIRIIEELAQRPDVSHIYANPRVKLSQPESDFNSDKLAPTAVNTIEWNILKVKADQVWAAGYTGQGVVIGGQDTGYDWDHSALINQYRGWDGATANHDYNWFDATSGGSPDVPVDPHSHGTHTMGTIVGDDGGSNQIGVAPDAKWIGCRNMDSSGYGTPATYAACYQWFVAPTRTDGSDPRPDLAPTVINNSWSCPDYEGCTEPDVLLAVVQAVRAAGILTVHSAGNSGPACATVNEPATIYAESFSVGATDNGDSITNFSSRGPVTADGSNRLKPQVSAPGAYIRSAIPGGGYGTKSGTSMAAPHVTGLAALLISVRPELAGQVEKLETIIKDSALPLYTNAGCGGDTLTSHPNHTYGWGLIDAWAAYLPHLKLEKRVSTTATPPGSLLTYTLTIENTGEVSPAHDLILEDHLPNGTDFISATGNYSITGNLVTWAVGDLVPGVTENVELVVQVPITTPLGTIVNNQYSAHSDEIELVSGEPVSTTIHKLSVNKSAPEVILRGFPLTYTLTVTNLQEQETTHQVVLTDTIPERTSFITATGSYSTTGKLVSWVIGDLAAGASNSVQLVVRTPVTSTGTITNAFYGAVSDEVSKPAKGQAVHTLIQSPELKLSNGQSGMIVDPCTPSIPLIYSHQITNTGNYTDTFQFSLNSSLEWANLNIDQFTLASGEAARFDIEINPPCPISPGTTEISTVTARSLADLSVTGIITDSTIIGFRRFVPLIFADP